MIKILYEDNYSEKKFIQLLKKFIQSTWGSKETKNFADIILDYFDKGDEDTINFYISHWENYLNIVSRHLKKYRIYAGQVDLRNVLEDYLQDEIEGDPPSFTRIYPENGTIGWILNLKNGEIEFFEGSDEELTDEDIFFQKAFTPAQWIKLFSMQDYDFVQSWKIKGIPPETFFAVDKNIARSYWHTKGNDILISIELWSRDIQRVDDQAFKTIDINKNFKNLKTIG